MRWLAWAILCGVVWSGCSSVASFGRYGFMVLEPQKVGAGRHFVAIPGQVYRGESCTSFFFGPIGDGFQHMERAVTEALQQGSASKEAIGLADVEVSQQIHYYFLYTNFCWVVEGIAAQYGRPR